MKYIFLFLLLASPAKAALPDTIKDPSVRDALEFIDGKVNSILFTTVAYQSGSFVPLNNGLSAETANRISADSILQSDINTRVLKAGDTMTGDLLLPNLTATGIINTGILYANAASCSYPTAYGVGGTTSSYTLNGYTYYVHEFLSTGTFTFTPPACLYTVDVLIVDGGGAGGGGTYGGGGGGAGGGVSEIFSLSIGTSPISVVVGSGAVWNSGQNGAFSAFGAYTASGGGNTSGGGGWYTDGVGGHAGYDGWNGGGGEAGYDTGDYIAGGTGLSGFDGGAAVQNCASYSMGGGGAGAGESGGSALCLNPNYWDTYSGYGGNGVPTTISSGTIAWMGGGGGPGGASWAGNCSSRSNAGGAGGGGNGAGCGLTTTSGLANTGGGGGGSSAAAPGAGGSGKVSIRYIVNAPETLTTIVSSGIIRGAGDIYIAKNSYVTGISSASAFYGNSITLKSGVAVSSETSASLGAGVRISSNVYVVGFSSASKYYGDGS